MEVFLEETKINKKCPGKPGHLILINYFRKIHWQLFSKHKPYSGNLFFESHLCIINPFGQIFSV